MNRENSLYTILSGGLNFKMNNKLGTLSWSSVVMDLYTRRGYIIGALNKEQEQAWQVRKKKR